MKPNPPVSYDRYEHLQISREGRIVRVAIHNPKARNAVTEDLHEEIAHIFPDLDRDPECDVVILTGTGDAFCAGGDIAWMDRMRGDVMAHTHCVRNDRRIQNALLDLEKPIIARVVGPAIGLGCSLALFCDFIYATPNARFADPHVSVGLLAGDGGALIWPQLIGYARAKRYVMTGDPVTGADAAEMGLITEVVPEEKLDEVVDAMAQRLAKGATQSIRWTKASMNAGLKVIANAVMDRAAAYELASMHTADHEEAVKAFLGKTRPNFTGR